MKIAKLTGILLTASVVLAPGLPALASANNAPQCQESQGAILFLEIEGIETKCEGWTTDDVFRLAFFTESHQENHVTVGGLSNGLDFSYRFQDGWELNDAVLYQMSEQDAYGAWPDATRVGAFLEPGISATGDETIPILCAAEAACNLFRLVVSANQPASNPAGYWVWTFFIRVDPPCDQNSQSILFLEVNGVDTKFSGWEGDAAFSVLRENHLVIPNLTSSLEFEYGLCDGWELSEVELFRFNSELRYGGFEPDQGTETAGSGSIAFSDCEVPLTVCNLFRLEFSLVKPGPDEERKTYNFFILERSLDASPTVNVTLNLLDGQEADETNWSDDEIGQRWYQLPRVQNTANPANSLYQAFETNAREVFYSSATFMPVFENTTFYATADDGIEIKILDRTFEASYCLEFPEGGGNFVFFRPDTVLIPCFYDPNFGLNSTNRFLRDSDTSSFYLTVYSVCDFESPADNMVSITAEEPRPCRNELGLSAAVEMEATLRARDHRVASDYGDEVVPVATGNRLTFGERWVFEDSDFSSRAWVLNLDYDDTEGVERAIELNFVLVDDVTVDGDTGFSGYDLGDAYIFGDNVNFDVTPAQISMRFDAAYTDYDEDLGFEPTQVAWVKLPNQSNWDTEEYGPMRPNHTLGGWTSTSNATNLIFPDDYFPMLEDGDNIYPIWIPPVQGDGGLNQGGAPPVDQNPGPVQQPSPPVDQNPGPIQQQPPTSNETTITLPPIDNQVPAEPKTFKTSLKISFLNGRTFIEAAIPPKYVNAAVVFQKRVIRRGKVSYISLSRGWSHFEKVTKDRSKAVMRFSFIGALRLTDEVRVKARGITVIKSFGNGESAWK